MTERVPISAFSVYGVVEFSNSVRRMLMPPVVFAPSFDVRLAWYIMVVAFSALPVVVPVLCWRELIKLRLDWALN